LLLLFISAAAFSQTEKITPAILDLSEQDFTSQKITINSQWDFFWKKMLKADDSISQTTTSVSIPQLWKDVSVDGEQISSLGYATYRLKIMMPSADQKICLLVPRFFSSYTLFANGKKISENGVPDSLATSTFAFWEPRIAYLPEQAKEVLLVLHVANFTHAKGGSNQYIQIGSQRVIEQTVKEDLGAESLLSGCLLMGGLFFLGLFLFNQKEKAILCFSFFCLSYGIMQMGSETYSIQTFFPGTGWIANIRILYCMLFTSITLFGLYVRYLFPADTNRAIIAVLSTINILYALIVMSPDSVLFTGLFDYMLLVILVNILYALYVFIVAGIRKRKGAAYAVLSLVAILFVFAVSMATYFSYIQPHKFVQLAGYVAFFFFQSLALAHRFSYELRNSKQLAEEALSSKTDFLSVMSHEIRTPLSAVIGSAHLLQNANPTKEQKENLDILLFSAQNLLSIVNDILDYSKLEASKVDLEKIDMSISHVAKKAILSLRSVADKKNLPVNLHMGTNIPDMVVGDPTRLSQLLYNLLQNAVKFTERGSVDLFIDLEKSDGKTATVKFKIKDTGIGIAPEKVKTIFEPFMQADASTTRSYGGTGLGLSICIKLLKLYDSKLELVSERGRGSEFSFQLSLPVSEIKTSNTAESIKIAADLKRPFEGLAVLLVEDNDLNIKVAKSFLERWGIVVTVAINGLDAIQKFDNTIHRLILMDLQMPVLDGFEAASHIRSNGNKLPIIALTANAVSEVADKIHSSGINAVVSKPFRPDELKQALHKYVYN
jgi:two-component system, sensor histidine kinase